MIRDEYVKIVEKYQALRPTNTPIDRFFLQYRKGKCVRQPMGSTKIGGMPREIATFLGLQEPEQYTGHCFRRTSATLLADSGADLTTLKRHGGLKSSTVAEVYIEDSIDNKSKICKGIKVESLTLKKSCPDHWTRPSTSKDSAIEKHSESPLDNPSVSPTFTMESNEIEQCSAKPKSLSSNKHTYKLMTQVKNTRITVPKKNVTFNISNCKNFTFNF